MRKQLIMKTFDSLSEQLILPLKHAELQYSRSLYIFLGAAVWWGDIRDPFWEAFKELGDRINLLTLAPGSFSDSRQ